MHPCALLLFFLLVAVSAFGDPARPSTATVTPVLAAQPTETPLPASAPPKVAPAPVAAPTPIDVRVTVDQPKEGLKETVPVGFGYGMKISDLLMVLGTIALAAFTFLLWRRTHDLWKEAIKGGATAQQAANAAFDSAIAARDSAAIAVAAEQPRWIMDTKSFRPYEGDNHSWARNCQTRVTLKNVGRTDAQVLQVITRAMFIREGDDIDAHTRQWPAETKEPVEVGEILIAPGKRCNAGNYLCLTSEEVRSLFKKEYRLFISGEILYRDFRDQLMVKGFAVIIDSDHVDWDGGDDLPKAIHEARGPRWNRYTFARAVAEHQRTGVVASEATVV